MNYFIIIILFFVASVFWILGSSFKHPIYNPQKDAYDLDYENERIGDWFIIVTFLIIFFAGSLL